MMAAEYPLVGGLSITGRIRPGGDRFDLYQFDLGATERALEPAGLDRAHRVELDNGRRAAGPVGVPPLSMPITLGSSVDFGR